MAVIARQFVPLFDSDQLEKEKKVILYLAHIGMHFVICGRERGSERVGGRERDTEKNRTKEKNREMERNTHTL